MSQLFLLPLLLLLAAATIRPSESSCRRGCSLALASYYLSTDTNLQLNLTYIASLFGQTVQDVLPYNPAISNHDYIVLGTTVNISLTTCDCVDGNSTSLGHTLSYTVQGPETYASIAYTVYSNLTTAASLEDENSYPAVNIPDGARINVTIGCYCGDAAISNDYGLFITYPLQPGETLASVAANFSLSGQEALLRSYNPGNNFSGGIVYIPVKDQYGSSRPLRRSGGVSAGTIAGISIAVIAALIIPICIYVGVYMRKKAKKATILTATFEDRSTQSTMGDPLQIPIAYEGRYLNMQKSVEFTYKELAKATNDFNLANKIGEGGFGVVYYAELRGEEIFALYARNAEISPKVDVYAYGVVLYELISAKEAVIETGSSDIESKPLVALFLNAFNQSDQEEHLKKLVDPRLGDDYPIESVLKMTHIAKACTEEDRELRSTIRSVIIELVAL